MRIASIFCFVFTVVTGLIGAKQATAALADQAGKDPEYIVGYVVGSFIVPAAFLAASVFLWKKANRKSAANPE